MFYFYLYVWFGFEALKGRKCRLLILLQKLEQSQFLGGETSEDESSGGDGGRGSTGSGQDETSGSGEGGGAQGVQQEHWLSHGHAQQADGESDSE